MSSDTATYWTGEYTRGVGLILSYMYILTMFSFLHQKFENKYLGETIQIIKALLALNYAVNMHFREKSS